EHVRRRVRPRARPRARAPARAERAGAARPRRHVPRAMNAWLVAATALLLCLVPLGLVLVRAGTIDRLVALQVATAVDALAFVCLAQGFDRTVYSDAALVLALLSIAGSLAFARFLERWL